MHLGALLPMGAGTDPAALAVRAEAWGYDSVWLGELWRRSSVVTLTEIACSTEEIGLGTAIANVFSRSPATLAMTARSLEEVSDGRFNPRRRDEHSEGDRGPPRTAIRAARPAGSRGDLAGQAVHGRRRRSDTVRR